MNRNLQAGLAIIVALAGLAALPGADNELTAIGKRFEAGQLPAAREDYLELLAEEPNAALHYNLGRTDQALGARPQAVLWYRRALALAPEDPWALDNLESLRSDLGVPAPDAGRPLAALLAADAWSGWVAGLGLCVVLASRWLGGRPRRWALIFTAASLLGGHLAIQGAAAVAPVEAVLMTACEGADGNLPAGSEVWRSRSARSRVWSAGSRFDCDPESIIAVGSDRLPPAPASQEQPRSAADEAAPPTLQDGAVTGT